MEENENLIKILKEHREILDLIEKSEEILFDQKELEIEELKNNLLNHSKFEDEVFYPNLDEILTKEQKQEMINRIRDIIIE